MAWYAIPSSLTSTRLKNMMSFGRIDSLPWNASKTPRTIIELKTISIMNEALRGEFERLKCLVPTSLSRMMTDIGQDVTKAREELMKVHRLIFLTKLHTVRDIPKLFPRGDLWKFLGFISAERTSRNADVPPRQAQFMGKIVDFFIKNPSSLVEVCKNARRSMKDPKFKLFCRSCVPALFGFYSSKEHLLISMPFFAELVKLKQKDIVFSLLEPFFCNITTYRFIESIADWLVRIYCPSVMRGPKEVIYQRIVEEFKTQLFQFLKLLPSEHLAVLNGLVVNGMKKTDVFKFFVDNFLRPQLLLFVFGSPYVSTFASFDRLMEQIKSFSEKEIEPLFSAESRLEIPSVFCSFGLPYVYFFISPRDVQILYKMSKGIEFPTVLKMTMQSEFIHKQSFLPVWLKLYPKNIASHFKKEEIFLVFGVSKETAPEIDIPHFRRRYLVLKNLAAERHTHPVYLLESKDVTHFAHEETVDLNALCSNCRMKLVESEGNIEFCETCSKNKLTFTDFVLRESILELKSESQIFERFMAHRANLMTLKSFSQTAFHLYDLVLSQYSGDFSSRLSDLEKLGPVYKNRIRITKQIVYASELYRPFLSLNQQWEQWVRALGQEWDVVARNDLVKVSYQDVLSQAESPTTQLRLVTRFNEIVQQLSVLNGIPEARRYFLLAICLKELDSISRALGQWNLLVLSALKTSTFDGIWSFLLCSTLLMKKDEFHELCTVDELNRWWEFEKVMLDFIEKHEELSEIYETLESNVLIEM